MNNDIKGTIHLKGESNAMVIEMLKYKCEVCNQEYVSYKEAKICEQRGIEEPLLKVGDKIIYEVLENTFGMLIPFNLMVSDVIKEGHIVKYSFYEEYDEGYGESSVLNCVNGNEELKEKFKEWDGKFNSGSL